MPRKERLYIFKDLRSSVGATNSRKLYTCTGVKDGKTQVCVELRVTKRFRVQDIEKAESLYDRMDHMHFELDHVVEGH